MANAIKQISIAARLRRHALHAGLLRRRRRPARLPGRRRARHERGLDPSARRRAVGLRHGPRRPAARCASARSRRRSTTSLAPSSTAAVDELRRAAREELRAQGVAPMRIAVTSARVARELRRHRHAARRAARRADAMRAALRGGAPPALRLRRCRAARWSSRRSRSRRSARRSRSTSRSCRSSRARRRSSRSADPLCTIRALHRRPGRRRRRLSTATTCGPATGVAGPAMIARGDRHDRVVEPGWRARGRRAATTCPRARRAAAAARRARHRRRSGAARDVQQPLHGDRRADGRGAAEHRLFGQHQGAARFLLRPVRRRRRPDRQRAAHAGAPGLDGRERAHRHRARRGGERGMQPGDVFALNDPYNGGTHLPDITVVMPVFARGRRDRPVLRRRARPPCRYRRHHARLDAAGQHARRRGGRADRQLPAGRRAAASARRELRALLASGRYPARNPDQNIADLKAQIAACAARASNELRRMVGAFRAATWSRPTWATCRTTPRRRCAACSTALKDGAFALRDGRRRGRSRCAITIDRDARAARPIDFTGTSAAARRPTSTRPSAVCRAAVLYVFRTLVDDDIPMNAGCLKPLDIVIPDGLDAAARAIRPRWSPAMSRPARCVTDALYGALGRAWPRRRAR